MESEGELQTEELELQPALLIYGRAGRAGARPGGHAAMIHRTSSARSYGHQGTIFALIDGSGRAEARFQCEVDGPLSPVYDELRPCARHRVESFRDSLLVAQMCVPGASVGMHELWLVFAALRGLAATCVALDSVAQPRSNCTRHRPAEGFAVSDTVETSSAYRRVHPPSIVAGQAPTRRAGSYAFIGGFM
ncbi:hypothetical protein L226DRAFT_144802 [Lentinus tigrinus ALCF2SS1-7]|uniref:Uncharacterized protein n=1 Tax=Lentinus tigrinus ALCF2SS1-6 TaxID=1328759 RepID=A0A5C2S4N6_9APHY|nr:hypothetical protein L227DRAFT_183319 [Lentinus tigrinus ALCF2SS1-6]RPD72727.1 hypothetical protein L226DRAFT_144802 [Lentinus tigrinus ALCF2SS1-7]